MTNYFSSLSLLSSLLLCPFHVFRVPLLTVCTLHSFSTRGSAKAVAHHALFPAYHTKNTSGSLSALLTALLHCFCHGLKVRHLLGSPFAVSASSATSVMLEFPYGSVLGPLLPPENSFVPVKHKRHELLTMQSQAQASTLNSKSTYLAASLMNPLWSLIDT